MSVKQNVIKLIAWGMLIGIALLGTAIHKDYGISWDEETNKNITLLAEQYVLKGDKGLFLNSNQFYGTAFEFILLFLERMFKANDTNQNIYFMRHLINFYFFLIGVFFFYLLARIKFKNHETMSLLAICVLVLSPRIFADAFYNSKDIPFLSAFIISIYTLLIYLKERTVTTAIIHAILCAFLIDLRVVGILVPALTSIFLVMDIILVESYRKEWFKALKSWFVYGLCLVFLTILFWPYLWEQPFTKFAEAYKVMSHYNWGGTVLYLGEYIKADHLPWHYIPVWILITTPILYIVFFVAAIFKLICLLIAEPLSFYKDYKFDLICLCWLLIPIMVVITKKSVLYDGWRQMFFIYPAFLMISLEGVASSLEWARHHLKNWKKTFGFFFIISIVSANSVFIMIKMTNLHPFQNIYFNMLAGKNLMEIKKNFELDYWGLSFRKALEFIVKQDERQTIKVHPSNLAGDANIQILNPSDQKRLFFLRAIEGADYFVTNYRWHHTDYDLEKEIFSVEREGAKIVSVFKLK